MSEENNDLMLIKTSNKVINTFQNKCGQALMNLMDDEGKVKKFLSSMQVCFSRNPKLSKCTQESIFNVFLQCAEWGLFPSTVTGECYVIPYKDEATFQLGYQGIITLAYRAGVQHLDAQIVYKNDLFEYEYGLNQNLKHVPDKFSDDRGKPIGAYAVATLESGKQKFEILNESDIIKHRAKSQSYSSNKKYSPWNPENDPQLIMWKKTVLKQLFKMLPKSPIAMDIIGADVKGDIIDVKNDPDYVELTDSDKTDFIKRLIQDEGYTDKEIKAATKQVTGGENLTVITQDQAADIEQRLIQNRDIAAAGGGDPADGGEKQAELIK